MLFLLRSSFIFSLVNNFVQGIIEYNGKKDCGSQKHVNAKKIQFPSGQDVCDCLSAYICIRRDRP